MIATILTLIRVQGWPGCSPMSVCPGPPAVFGGAKIGSGAARVFAGETPRDNHAGFGFCDKMPACRRAYP